MNEVKGQLREFIASNFLFTDGRTEFADDQSLVQSGIIDSTGVLELIAFLEDRFGVVPTDDELTPDNLDSLDRLATFIARKQSCAG
jgi:acyl carrier protein